SVAQLLEGPSRGRIERRRLSEVTRGVVQVPALTVGLAALQVRKGRVGPEHDRAAVIFDGRQRVACGLGRIALRHQIPVLAFTLGGLIRNCYADGSYGQDRHHEQNASHRSALSYRTFRAGQPGFRNFGPRPGSKFDTMISVKQAGAVGWSEVSSGEAALIQRCASGDEIAFAELVTEHQRKVVQLAVNLLGDPDEALDHSQEVFLRGL